MHPWWKGVFLDLDFRLCCGCAVPVVASCLDFSNGDVPTGTMMAGDRGPSRNGDHGFTGAPLAPHRDGRETQPRTQ